jgi:anti-anti-sigma factor
MLLQSARTERPRGFRLIGEVDLSNQGEVSSLLAPEVALGGDITLDLSELVFMDSAGVRVLLEAARGLVGRGQLCVTGMRAGLRRTFDIMGVHQAPGMMVMDGIADADSVRAGFANDLAGDSHPVMQARCACGCPYLYATDDMALFWEPGGRIAEGCSDRSCECHVSPLMG